MCLLLTVICRQDFTGVPAVVDLACMRDALNKLGSDSNKINPLVRFVLSICPFDIVEVTNVGHSDITLARNFTFWHNNL